MPIQHVNDNILQSMHRATSRKEIISTLELLRSEIPNITIRTSLIVGFPGETDGQFNELVDFLKKYPIDNVGIFKYSKEEGSHAATLPNHISDPIKEKREKKLSAAQQKQSKKLLSKKMGKVLDVVVEGYHPESPLLLVGRHAGQCPEIDGLVILNDSTGVDEFGKIYQVKITEALDYDLIGHVAQKPC